MQMAVIPNLNDAQTKQLNIIIDVSDDGDLQPLQTRMSDSIHNSIKKIKEIIHSLKQNI